jgi:hypothetical protein
MGVLPLSSRPVSPRSRIAIPPPAASVETVEGWDSIPTVTLLTVIQEQLGIRPSRATLNAWCLFVPSLIKWRDFPFAPPKRADRYSLASASGKPAAAMFRVTRYQ